MSAENNGNRNPNDKQKKDGTKDRSDKGGNRPEPARPNPERQPIREDDDRS